MKRKNIFNSKKQLNFFDLVAKTEITKENEDLLFVSFLPTQSSHIQTALHKEWDTKK